MLVSRMYYEIDSDSSQIFLVSSDLAFPQSQCLCRFATPPKTLMIANHVAAATVIAGTVIAGTVAPAT